MDGMDSWMDACNAANPAELSGKISLARLQGPLGGAAHPLLTDSGTNSRCASITSTSLEV